MKPDPANDRDTTWFSTPPSHGPGSGKAAWVAFAGRAADANASLMSVIDEQSEVIRHLQAEIELLRAQIAAHKPKGARERLPDETVNRIEQAISAGLSTRTIGKRFKISAMTVSRIRKRMQAREAQAA
jgi:uncharacterized small protein (DUF1192 family)